MESTIKELINKALRECFDMAEVAFAVERPKELTHGDYATNVAAGHFKNSCKESQ